jgi:hypothetical protein
MPGQIVQVTKNMLVVKKVSQWGDPLSPICYYQINAEQTPIGFARYEKSVLEICCDNEIRGDAFQAIRNDLIAEGLIGVHATVTLMPIIGLFGLKVRL